MRIRKTLPRILALVMLAVPAAAFAQPAVFVVRHAERADAGMTAPSGADPDLSSAGRERAESLAALLKDARITQIYVTEFKRTLQTAAPLAKTLGLEPTVVPSKDTSALVARLKAPSGNVLVVGHSNTLPVIVKALGISEPIAIGETAFDNLLIITSGASPSLVRLHYR